MRTPNSKQPVLHLTERHLNSQLTVRLFRGSLLAFQGDQPVADVNHRFDLQSKIGELCPQAIDVNVEAFGVERLVRSPDRTPKLVRRDDPVWRARQSREDQKLGAGQLDRTAPARDVVVLMFDTEKAIVVDVFCRAYYSFLLDSC
jgi:hypothetical protein